MPHKKSLVFLFLVFLLPVISSCAADTLSESLTPEEELERLLLPHTILHPVTRDVIEEAGNPRVRDNRSRRFIFGGDDDNVWQCSFVYTSNNDKVMICE